MPRILLVSYEFPPRGGPGVQRPLKLAKYLAREGADVTVLTVADPPTSIADESLLEELPDEVDVIRAWSLEPTRLLQMVRRLRRRRVRDGASAGEADPTVRGYSGAPEGLIKLVQSAFVPDEKRFWVPFAVRRGLRSCRDRGVDIIISTGPPHSAHLVAARLGRRLGIPFVVDLRDPWSEYFAYRPLTPLHRWMNERAERRTLAGAAASVVVTESMAERQRRRHPEVPVEVVRNGYDDEDLPQALATQRSEFRIVYTGTFSGPRSPRTFLEGLAELERRRPEVARTAEVVFVGAGAEVVEAASRSGVTTPVIGAGYVPHDESLEMLASADVALLILSSGEESAVSLSGKVFEYLGMRLPILGVVGEGEAATFLGSIEGAVVALFDDPERIASAIEGMFDAWQDGTLRGPAEADVRPYSRIEQARQYLRLIERTVSKEGHRA